jgi:TolB-like protein
MASIVQGYEYDIFISYRQKDNKGDRWVSEFVEALKNELESTFKEEISVYFDINPHNGLLETHDVDASLKEKVKCLVFIPIISQTYCDPKSFAWQHEFVTFNKLAKEDHYSRDIRLAGGNVASRILPVKIHDLDPEDNALLENELGGVLRAIEFIYKSSGVNRPLKPSDNPDKNLNKTYYRDQVNKVANAVKEIITAIKKYSLQVDEISRDVPKAKHDRLKNIKPKIVLGSLIFLTLILLVYFLVPKKNKYSDLIEKSIAVLPFLNYSTEPDQEAMSEGITDEIIDHLSKIKSFTKVVSLRNVLIYKESNKNILQIANELQVNYILDGTYKKIGDQVKIRVTLVEPKHDNRLWQDEYDRPYKELIAIQAEISLQISNKLNAFLSNSELQNIQKIPTTSQEAYEMMQRALYYTRSADVGPAQISDLALKAIKLDPSYADAHALAGIMALQNGTFAGLQDMSSAAWDALPYFEKALELDPNNALAHFGMGNIYEWGRWDYINAEKEYLMVFEDGSNNAGKNWNVSLVAEFFLTMNRLDYALKFLKIVPDKSFEHWDLSVRINGLSENKTEVYKIIKNTFSESGEKFPDEWIGEDYIWIQEYDSAKVFFESALQSKDPLMLIPRFQADLSLVYFKTKNFEKSRAIINKLKVKSSETTVGSPEYFIGWFYSGIGEVDSAILWLEKACKNKSPELSWLKIDPVFINLKNDARYWDLYARTGHKDYDDYVKGIKKK